jgi:hypothetical protein
MKFGQIRNGGSALPAARAQASLARRGLLGVGTLLPAVLLWGCSGFVNGQNTNPPPPPPQTYNISGTITPAAGGNGATVTLSGAGSATTTANSAGNFTVPGLANGTYTVTPSRAGFNFTPSSMKVTINGANITTGLNFTATAVNFSISGTITPTAGGSGATVTLSGAATATTTADGTGKYTFSGLSNGTYAVTPRKTGYTFNPSVQTATVNGANVTGINFTATVQVSQTFSISGTISPTSGGSGAKVALSGAAVASTTSDSAGKYTFSGLSNGTYTVTPTNTGFAFTPTSQSVSIINANVSGVNFTASVQVTHTVALSWVASTTATVTGYNVYRSTVSGTGFAKVNSSPLSVLSYTDAAVINGTTYFYVTTAVDASGVESLYSNEATAVIP